MLFLIRWLLPLALLLSQSVFAANTFSFPQGELQLLPLHKTWNEQSKKSFALSFTLKKDWHIYWKNSGDSGAPPKWTWTLQNAKVTAEHWPTPARIPVAGLINIGYSDAALFVFDFEAQELGKPVEVAVNLEFLVCKVECVPYFTELRTEIPYSSQTGPPEALFTKFTYPSAAPEALIWVSEKSEASVLSTTLTLPADLKIKNLEIFPADGENFKPVMPELIPDGDQFTINLSLHDTNKTDFKGSPFLLVTENTAGEKKAYEVELQGPTPTSLAIVLMWALLGGFILNFMPCVFPVLSIKVLSFLGPDKNAHSLRVSGDYYTLGVISSFVALGGGLMLLRAGGEQIGWGFQLQSPLVAAGISILFFWLGLNFLGAFEIGQSLTYLGAKKTTSDRAGSFMTGVLATIVATPCTAPFMGAALGASLAMPLVNTLLVFAGLGLGMAFPFLILAYFPKAIALLPKPGAWMEKLKGFLAFPLFATVIWLLWVLSYQVAMSGVFYLLGVYLLTALWVWAAKYIRSEKRKQYILLLGFFVSLGFLALMPKEPVAATSVGQVEVWKSFKPEDVAKDLSEGKSVFIDFTAAWCITCQVNKRLVLHTPEINTAFTTNQVQLYKADWTDKNPIITQALASYGRNSLPLYVYYEAGSKKPRLLPEILTKGIVLNLFNKETK